MKITAIIADNAETFSAAINEIKTVTDKMNPITNLSQLPPDILLISYKIFKKAIKVLHTIDYYVSATTRHKRFSSGRND
ncbi:MAG: hypothetical protein NT120_04135 [Candidatus Aenigmarchaeota archaeon]|nr:hypothetical protein [Candidatus Aenigmarchaeota archaeon]